MGRFRIFIKIGNPPNIITCTRVEWIEEWEHPTIKEIRRVIKHQQKGKDTL